MQTYFNTFSTINYDSFIVNNETKVVTDIFKRVRASGVALADKSHWYTYVVPDGESPETVAYKYYGSAQYHWVLLLINKVHDPQWDWHLSAKAFDRYISKKYGSVENAKIEHSHYETIEIIADEPIGTGGSVASINDIILPGGQIVGDDTFVDGYSLGSKTWTEHQLRKQIFAYDKEEADNEAKRSIILLKKEVLGKFVEEFKNLVIESE
jgi:hypothetical protein